MRPAPRKIKLAVKKNRILNEIFREGDCSRFDLAKRLNINPSMAGQYVEQFLTEGLLEEAPPAVNGPGRAPRPLRLRGGYGDFLGLDFEALRARAVLTDFSGMVRCQDEITFHADIRRGQVLSRIVRLAKRLAQKSDHLMAVGVAAPGQVDSLNGTILRYELLAEFADVPIRDHFARHFDVPLIVEDNIRALTYAELLRGNGRGHRNFLCLAVRSGVGLGIVIDGRLYAGAGLLAGEIGYNVFPHSGKTPRVTELISAKGIVHQALQRLTSARTTPRRKALLRIGEDLLLEDVVCAARNGDVILSDLLETVGTNLGVVVANLANLFAPETILLTGEVPHCCPAVSTALEKTFRKYTLPQIQQTTRLGRGSLGGFAAAEGAAFRGFATLFPESESTLVAAEKAQRQLVLTQ